MPAAPPRSSPMATCSPSATAAASTSITTTAARRSRSTGCSPRSRSARISTSAAPPGMIDWARERAAALGWPAETVHFEHFAAPQPGLPFDVTLAVSGKTIRVGEQQSLLEAIEAAGVDPPYLCRGGVCGQCETNVISCDGKFLHNDHWLIRGRAPLGQEDHALRVALRGPLARPRTVGARLGHQFPQRNLPRRLHLPEHRRSTSGAFRSRSTRTATCMRSTSSRMSPGPRAACSST